MSKVLYNLFNLFLSVYLISITKSASTGGYGGSSGGGGGGGGGGVYGAGNIVNVGGNGIGLNAVTNTGPIPAAIQSSHTVEIQSVNVPQNPITPQVIEVDANVLPLTIHFKSASSNINVVQSHQPGQVGEMQQTSSEDEPHHLVHEVTKPIIQEVREVITPYRRVIQEIRPVQEDIQTIVARGEHRQQQQNNLDFSGFSSGGQQFGQGSGGGYGGNIGGFAGGYAGAPSSGGYGGSTGGGSSISLLGGQVRLLSDSESTGVRTTGSPSLSSFSSSSSGAKKSKSDSTSSSSGTKEYAKKA